MKRLQRNVDRDYRHIWTRSRNATHETNKGSLECKTTRIWDGQARRITTRCKSNKQTTVHHRRKVMSETGHDTHSLRSQSLPHVDIEQMQVSFWESIYKITKKKNPIQTHASSATSLPIPSWSKEPLHGDAQRVNTRWYPFPNEQFIQISSFFEIMRKSARGLPGHCGQLRLW